MTAFETGRLMNDIWTVKPTSHPDAPTRPHYEAPPWMDLRRPIPVRGHHIANLIKIVQGYDTPEGIAQKEVDTIKHGIEEGETTAVRYLLDIAKDLTELPRKADELAQTYGTLLTLPDNHLIDLVTKPDVICGIPEVGKHCRMKDTRLYGGGSDAFEADKQWIRLVYAKAIEQKVDHEITPVPEIVRYTDAPQVHQTQSQRLTIGRLKAILAEVTQEDINFRAIPRKPSNLPHLGVKSFSSMNEGKSTHPLGDKQTDLFTPQKNKGKTIRK